MDAHFRGRLTHSLAPVTIDQRQAYSFPGTHISDRPNPPRPFSTTSLRLPKRQPSRRLRLATNRSIPAKVHAHQTPACLVFVSFRHPLSSNAIHASSFDSNESATFRNSLTVDVTKSAVFISPSSVDGPKSADPRTPSSVDRPESIVQNRAASVTEPVQPIVCVT